MRQFASVSLLVVLVLAGCGVSTQPRAEAVDDSSVPFGLLDPDAPPIVPTSAPAGAEEVSLCFVADDNLVSVPRVLEPPVGLRDAIAALADLPADEEPLRTAVSDAAMVGDIRLASGIARVDLRESISTLGADIQLLAVAQIVCTLTGRPGVGQVSFSVEGAPVDVPRADGSLVSEPVSRDDYASLISPTSS
jgi:spore germination protein GerM